MSRHAYEMWGYHTPFTISALALFFADSWSSLMFFSMHNSLVLEDPWPGAPLMWLASAYNSKRKESTKENWKCKKTG